MPPTTITQGDDLTAHWVDEKVETTRRIVQEAIADMRPSEEEMNTLWRMSSSRREEAQEAVQHELDVVLDESREQQARAEEHLAALRDICPGPVKELRTKQVVVDVLKQERDFLERLREAGLLETCEVGPAMNKIHQRLQLFDLNTHLGYVVGPVLQRRLFPTTNGADHQA